MDDHEFTRDPEIEAAAVKQLGYSPGQVKRKTLTQLKRELKWPPDEEAPTRPSKSRRPNLPKIALQSAKSKLKSKSPVVVVAKPTPPRENSDTLDKIDYLQQILLAKLRFTKQLENDIDFSPEELSEWMESIDRTRVQLKALIHGADYTDLLQKWERRQEKMSEMEKLGILDPELAKSWAEKQMRLHDVIENLKPDE